MTWKTPRIQKSGEGVAGGAWVTARGDPRTKLLPIESFLKYRFTTPKSLKICPGPGGCKTASLCNFAPNRKQN